MKKIGIIIAVVVLCASGCTSTLKEINSGLAAVNEGLSAANGSARSEAAGQQRSGASLSAQQKEKIRSSVDQKSQDRSMNTAISEAAEVIQAFIAENSCIAKYNGSALNRYAAPGKNFPSTNYIGAPMAEMRYHDKASCVSVLRIQGWEMRAKNALRFEVSYVSDASGEVVKKTNEVVKQPNGEWLFTR